MQLSSRRSSATGETIGSVRRRRPLNRRTAPCFRSCRGLRTRRSGAHRGEIAGNASSQPARPKCLAQPSPTLPTIGTICGGGSTAVRATAKPPESMGAWASRSTPSVETQRQRAHTARRSHSILASAPARYNFGNLLHGLGRNAEAIGEFERALALRPDHADTWNNLGRSLQEVGHLEEALAAFRRAVEFLPDSAIMHANLGTLLFGLRPKCRGVRRTASSAPARSQLLDRPRKSRRIAWPIRLSNRRGDSLPKCARPHSDKSPMADQPWRRAFVSRAARGIRSLLPASADIAARPCQWSWESAVCARVSHRRHARGDFCRVPGLESSLCGTSRIAANPVRHRQNTEPPPARRLRLRGLSQARRSALRGAVARCT